MSAPRREAGGGDDERWLRFAREDAALATRLATDTDVPPRIVCWHAQQAAEKALKAALASRGTSFPRTHNLVALRALLDVQTARGLDIHDLAELTAWGAEARYPGEWEEPSREDARQAAAAAERAVGAVAELIGEN